ncbi:MAG TPA: nitroreductase family protein, partial [Candidatus Sulfotelmatobacter sp.]|nr:nitroreductase family protein [Candidatus Sulfotelmatobacter sp.]
LAIVACGDLEAAFEQQLSYLLQDCSASIQNLLLGAHALGLGACWVGVHPSEEAIRQLRTLFALPASVLPIAAIALGYPGEQPEARTRYRPNSVHLEQW